MAAREIKFRIWDKKHQKFTYENDWLAIGLDGRIIEHYFWHDDYSEDIWNDWLDNKEFEIQQFTGLKDKNNREIYEGDIVKDLDGEIGEARFDYGSFIIKINKIIVPFYSLLETNGFVQPRLINPKCYEIIGNIFETPELLTK